MVTRQFIRLPVTYRCRREQEEDGRWCGKFPVSVCSRDEKNCCYGDALSTIFLLAFVPCFLLFVFRLSVLSFLTFFPASRYVYLLRVPSSVQQPSATLSKYEFYSTRSFCLYCVICTISRIGIFWFFYSSSIYFFVALISRVVCWTYSHHCQIADMKPSKGSWNGEFRGFRICVGWISTTRFCVVGFYVPY